jgi:hypothetical protein
VVDRGWLATWLGIPAKLRYRAIAGVNGSVLPELHYVCVINVPWAVNWWWSNDT